MMKLYQKVIYPLKYDDHWYNIIHVYLYTVKCDTYDNPMVLDS